MVKGFVDAVVILCRGAEIARHPRCYGEGMFVSNPLHYLALIETKPNALDQAAALQDWALPEVFQHLRHLLEALPLEVMTFAVTEAITLGVIGFDAVKLIALARIERRPARLSVGLSSSAQDDGEDDLGCRLCRAPAGGSGMTGTTSDAMPTETTSGTPQVLLAHHLKQLKLPTVLREYDKVARECARDGVNHPRYLLRLIELELLDRERRTVERRIRAARFPAVKSFDTFDFTAILGLNKMLVLELARCGYLLRRENIIALGNSGTGKTMSRWRLGWRLARRALRHVHDGGLAGQPVAGGARRAPPAQASARSAGGQAADRRRTRLCSVVADWCRTPVRDVLAAL